MLYSKTQSKNLRKPQSSRELVFKNYDSYWAALTEKNVQFHKKIRYENEQKMVILLD